MGAQIRVYRQKISSTTSMRKIFKAMELIATSRIGKARARVAASLPYANAITRAVSAVASQSEIDHPLTTEPEQIRRAAVLVITSDRGLAGSYSASVLKQAEGLNELLVEEQGSQDLPRRPQGAGLLRLPEPSLRAGLDRRHGRTGVCHRTGNRRRHCWPTSRRTTKNGVDEIHVVYTRFKSMVTQEPTVVRLLPLEVVEEQAASESDLLPLYEFEPETEQVLDALLPRYIESRIFAAMLQAAASELAARQRAMKSAGDNATELIKKYTRLRNTAPG